MNKRTTLPRVTHVEVQHPRTCSIYKLDLPFDDGVPMCEAVKGPAFFAQATVDHGTVVWPNGVDFEAAAPGSYRRLG